MLTVRTSSRGGALLFPAVAAPDSPALALDAGGAASVAKLALAAPGDAEVQVMRRCWFFLASLWLQAHAVVGVMKLAFGAHLLLVTDREAVGPLLGHEVWRVRGAAVLPLYVASECPARLRDDEARAVELMSFLLATGGFHYSPTADLSNSLQRQATREPEDARFVWNRQVRVCPVDRAGLRLTTAVRSGWTR